MNNDLIERLDNVIDRGVHALSPILGDLLKDCRAALSPVLPEDVEITAKHLRLLAAEKCSGKNGNYTVLTEWTAADLIERLARENASQKLALKVGPESYEKQIAEAQQRIDELERSERNCKLAVVIAKERIEELEKALDDAIDRMTQIGGGYSAKLIRNNLERIRGMK